MKYLACTEEWKALPIFAYRKWYLFVANMGLVDTVGRRHRWFIVTGDRVCRGEIRNGDSAAGE
jgi:hypothetical protein